MIRNYFTLYHVAQELHERLAGGYLFEIHSQDRNELTISFVTSEGNHLQLIVTVRSREFSLSTREGLNRKRRNTAGIMKLVYEHQVSGISMAPRDRELHITLEGGYVLAIRFYSADTNVLLVNNGLIADAFKDARELKGSCWDVDPAGESVFRSIEQLSGDRMRFLELLESTDNTLPLERRLATCIPGFDRDISRRLIARTGLTPTPEALFKSLGTLFFELASPTPYVIENTGCAPEFSIIEPSEPGDITPYDEVIDALNHYNRRMHRYLHLHTGTEQIRKELRQQISRLEKELAELESAGLDVAAERYETFGHLLMGAIGTTAISSERVVLPDICKPDAPWVTIPVKKELNMQQNAAWYFERAARSREKMAASSSRRKQVGELLDIARKKIEELDQPESEENRLRLVGKARQARAGETSKGRNSGEKLARFRTVQFGGGITLYIGKDARNNELLTFGMAKPDDIWLHAQGASGSHCILKGAGLHNMSEIRRAAEIAAWYSAAKNSGLVPVMYTLKKYVRKDRRALGSVIVEREKVVMVRPEKE
ncbi:MAG: DUF814 domain-containing protein [Chlorobiaceae bacterium]|nr:DUF814 domain-containing protein [Chlorobiaceae bacterium]